MSPEYAMMGVISIKTDIYSFGILLLEILSGKKNNTDYPFNLVFNVSVVKPFNLCMMKLYVIDLTFNKVCLL